MKKIHYFLSLLSFSLLFSSCDTNDNTFYSDVFVTSPDLVFIEASVAGYHVGDKIYISTTIDRLLDVTGQSNPVDIRKSTGNADKFNLSFVLEKETSPNVWEIIDANPSTIDVTAGTILGGSFYYVGAVYNSSTDSYNFRAGIPLLSTGNYRISFGYNSTSGQAIELRSESINNNLFVNIVSDEGNNLLNSEGFYNFTVL